MIMAWLLGKSFFRLPRWIFVLLGVVAAIALGLIVWTRMESADDKRNQEIGRNEERVEALEETVERTEKGNEAREEINRRDDVGAQLRYDQCLRSARTPENCKRFLPERPAN